MQHVYIWRKLMIVLEETHCGRCYCVSGKLLVAFQRLYRDGWARVRIGGRE